MDLAADLKAAEALGRALEGLDPAKLIDIAFKFMSSTRGRIEAGEKRIAGLEAKLATALGTVDKLSGILGAVGGLDVSQLQGEIEAMAGAKIPSAPDLGDVDPAHVARIRAMAAVLDAVPDADSDHVHEAVSVHAEAIGEGASHEDAKVAAETAARDVGASEEQAKAIAAAIPAPVGAEGVQADPPAAGGAVQ